MHSPLPQFDTDYYEELSSGLRWLEGKKRQSKGKARSKGGSAGRQGQPFSPPPPPVKEEEASYSKREREGEDMLFPFDLAGAVEEDDVAATEKLQVNK